MERKGECGMNLAMRVAIVGMSAWAAANGVAQSAGPAQPAAPAQPAVQAAMLQNLQVKEVNLAEIDTSHVKLAVDLNLTAAQSVPLQPLRGDGSPAADGKYGVCEDEVDGMLRGGVFVDLFKVVRQGLLVGEPSYSLKYVEHLYREIGR